MAITQIDFEPYEEEWDPALRQLLKSAKAFGKADYQNGEPFNADAFAKVPELAQAYKDGWEEANSMHKQK